MSTGEHQGREHSGKSSVDYAAIYEVEHPDAVKDPELARAMADATSGQEEKVVASIKNAEISASLGDNFTAQKHLDEARDQRLAANINADTVSRKWEETEWDRKAIESEGASLKSGKNPPLWYQAGYKSQVDMDNRPRG